ncbi:hypothetical protein LAV72_18555 [Lysinibacillus xylanilyticus]|uniref:hypothetical protein n=1 Tax=Lysinibacillus xylanilyticus TaxID=582475 RepID=UPI002B24FEE9|nr:hypothetical protein [Lysinibacillus xylanilyticus]MEB2301608.1 hypothetical protein [Lysinibacillus xylanilyticus]
MELELEIVYLSNNAKPLVDSELLSNYFTITKDVNELNRIHESTAISIIYAIISDITEFETLSLYLNMTGIQARIIVTDKELLGIESLSKYEKCTYTKWLKHIIRDTSGNPEPIPAVVSVEPLNQTVVQTPSEPVFFDDNTILVSGNNINTNEAEPIDNVTSQSVQYEEDPLHIRKRNIQKKLFANQQWSDHKIIGLWSPTGKTGVSLTTINLALSFAEQRIYTTVLEALNPLPNLKTHISRYSAAPNNWVSYASCIQEEYEPKKASWIYQNVVFLPSTQDDLQYTWNPPLIEAYMTTSKIADVTFVDFPSGRLAEYSLDALNYVDELWILFDDNYPALLKWKNYLSGLSQDYQVQLYGIMGRTYEFSQPAKISQEIGIPLLTTIPALDREIMNHYYEKEPLWTNNSVREALLPSYQTLFQHVFPEHPPMEKVDKESAKLNPVISFLKQLRFRPQ